MRSASAALLLLLLPALGGCTDVCEEGVCALQEQCGIAVERSPDDEACFGDRASFNQCIVDHTPSACAWFFDPLDPGAAEFAACVEAAAE